LCRKNKEPTFVLKFLKRIEIMRHDRPIIANITTGTQICALVLFFVASICSVSCKGYRTFCIYKKIQDMFLCPFICIFEIIFLNKSKIWICSLIIKKLWNREKHDDAALLQEIRNGKPQFPLHKTIFMLGKNNFSTFGVLL